MTNEDKRFIITSLINLYRPEREIIPNLSPMFYLTGSYEGDIELITKAKKIIEELEKYE
jgi:hypothetical protein